ncbi:D-alanyl-D-alanine carboxypeptidase [Hypericibacter adhaerens]|jgi:D-alanyl-D-alanine carboxypeptidase (penicillin-binding protein 5/6)|uniref:serine-type D-Ala-D-Ala carboxypeptidase n=2 Tax=Hypericibacter adhaerens TaxID=2602016 RepID=A0A5J6MZZ4_9PROT|nr:D-alanyl-D-alanine carboxypeptidase [Hypericibacter adhaerens]
MIGIKMKLVALRATAVAASALLATSLLAAGAARADTIDTTATEAYVLDYETGAVLLDKNAETRIQPASLSKLMTVYLLFEALKKGEVKLDDTFPVSKEAWALNEGSTMFVGIGDRIRVEDLIRGIVVQSGNDACLVVAEGLAGTEQAFVEKMNAKAKELGLNDSQFDNPHGLEDEKQLMTAHDVAWLAHHLIADFPEYYHYFSEKEFVFNGIKQGNRNPLLYKDPTVDGLKTGHLSISGYSVAVSAKRDGRRVIVVLIGTHSMQERSDESAKVLDWAYREFDNYTVAKAGSVLADAPVWLGQEATVPLAVGKDLLVTLPRAAHDKLTAKAVFEGPIPAPIAAGQEVGKVVISAPGMTDMEVPLVAGKEVPKLGFFGRMIAALKHFAGVGA